MLITIKGTYENGKITLEEKPPFDHKVNVLVTFLEEIKMDDFLKMNTEKEE
jgi:hypothetical protein